MNRLLIAAVAVVGTLTVVPATAASGHDSDLTVSIEPTEGDLLVGEEVTLLITVDNQGTSATAELVVHIDVTNPTGHGSVDPEDWSPTLTRHIGAVEAGSSRSLDWTLQPISPGTFRAYAVALPVAGGDEIWVSNGVTLRVQERRSLNPSGILPVAVAAPVGVGLLLLARMAGDRRRKR